VGQLHESDSIPLHTSQIKVIGEHLAGQRSKIRRNGVAVIIPRIADPYDEEND